MNTLEWPPRIGTWYLNWGKGEVFQVTGFDEKSHHASIKAHNGDVGEMDQVTWDGLSLGLADPPEDWAGPVETVDVVRFGTAQNDPVSEDVSGPGTSAD
jgi:hypothetical protein